MANLITLRGTSVCRGCGSNELFSVLDLESQPLPSEYGSSSAEVLDVFPLHMRICSECGLGQVGEYVLPERIFHKTYPYLSSASTTWVEHARNYAITIKNSLSLDNNSLVLELASNDGYLLSEFKKLGIPVLGVEPAANVATIAQEAGINTLVEFFGANIAKKIIQFHHLLLLSNINSLHISYFCYQTSVFSQRNRCDRFLPIGSAYNCKATLFGLTTATAACLTGVRLCFYCTCCSRLAMF